MTGQRSPASVRWHYDVERQLAARLGTAPPDERAAVYQEVYDELFERVPDHPQLELVDDPDETRRRVDHKLALIRRLTTPDTVLLEVGAGDGAFAAAVAGQVRRVVAVDVTDAVVSRDRLPDNVDFVLTDGTAVPVEPGSIDLAYSNQLMEHLHPDDAVEQLRCIARALRPGGRYLCITPNRLTGPHDISRWFDPVATGLHLREYRLAELEARFDDAGLELEQYFVGGQGRYLRVPLVAGRGLDRLAAALPEGARRRLRDTALLRAALGLTVVARRRT